ncbi:MAG TPA: AtpZ/AtpI family protein [Gemmatimonadales bacterium]|nr:AtpZ/AtpI family protein [Gemmatimonadales bacterium]
MKTPDPGSGKDPGPMRYAGLGIQLAVSLVVFVLIGQWADRKLGTGGIVTIAAAFLGFGGTMYTLIRSLNRKDGEDE